jgi:hypothetical protein
MTIRNWRRALGLGFLSWLLPFAISFAVFPLKGMNEPLFETVMSVAVVVTAALRARRMSAAKYYSEIGTGYLLYPAFLGGVAWLGRPA